MCKSVAEGGARCQAHTRQAVSTQMGSYATAMTSLNSEQAAITLRDLEAEGANLPDPSRDEVDAWLEQTITQVRFEPNLTESRRERIIRRLREALGKVTPSGATFHAWKNIMAEAWQRSRRKAAVFFTVGVITFSGGCGMGSGSVDPDPSPQSPGIVQVDGYSEFTAGGVPQPSVSAEVKSQFGEQGALDAYNFGAKTILNNQLNGETLSKSREDVTADDIADVRAALTPVRQRDLDDRLSNISTDESAYADIAALKGVGASAGQLQVQDPTSGKTSAASLRSDVPSSSINRSVSKPQLSVDSDGRLKATFTSSGVLRATAGGDNYLVPISNKTSLWFQKSGDQWKIDGWTTDWTKNAGPSEIDPR